MNQTVSKLQMTDKTLLKHMKRLNKDVGKTDYLDRELITSQAYTQFGATMTTDSHRLLVINQTVENEVTKDSKENFMTLDNLYSKNKIERDYYFTILDRQQMNQLRQTAKYIVAMSDKETIPLVEFKYSYTSVKSTLSVMNGNDRKDYATVLAMEHVENLNLDDNTKSIDTFVRAKYLVDMLDFAYDSKVSSIELRVGGHFLKPIRMITDEFEYLLLPVKNLA